MVNFMNFRSFLVILTAYLPILSSTGCFAFGDGSFSHGCTRSPVDLLRYLATYGRDELRRLQNAEISLVLTPPGGAAPSTLSKGAPPLTVAEIRSRNREENEEEEEELDRRRRRLENEVAASASASSASSSSSSASSSSSSIECLGEVGVHITENEIRRLIEDGEDIVVECPNAVVEQSPSGNHAPFPLSPLVNVDVCAWLTRSE